MSDKRDEKSKKQGGILRREVFKAESRISIHKPSEFNSLEEFKKDPKKKFIQQSSQSPSDINNFNFCQDNRIKCMLEGDCSLSTTLSSLKKQKLSSIEEGYSKQSKLKKLYLLDDINSELNYQNQESIQNDKYSKISLNVDNEQENKYCGDSKQNLKEITNNSRDYFTEIKLTKRQDKSFFYTREKKNDKPSYRLEMSRCTSRDEIQLGQVSQITFNSVIDEKNKEDLSYRNFNLKESSFNTQAGKELFPQIKGQIPINNQIQSKLNKNQKVGNESQNIFSTKNTFSKLILKWLGVTLFKRKLIEFSSQRRFKSLTFQKFNLIGDSASSFKYYLFSGMLQMVNIFLANKLQYFFQEGFFQNEYCFKIQQKFSCHFNTSYYESNQLLLQFFQYCQIFIQEILEYCKDFMDISDVYNIVIQSDQYSNLIILFDRKQISQYLQFIRNNDIDFRYYLQNYLSKIPYLFEHFNNFISQPDFLRKSLYLKNKQSNNFLHFLKYRLFKQKWEFSLLSIYLISIFSPQFRVLSYLMIFRIFSLRKYFRILEDQLLLQLLWLKSSQIAQFLFFFLVWIHYATCLTYSIAAINQFELDTKWISNYAQYFSYCFQITLCFSFSEQIKNSLGKQIFIEFIFPQLFLFQGVRTFLLTLSLLNLLTLIYILLVLSKIITPIINEIINQEGRRSMINSFLSKHQFSLEIAQEIRRQYEQRNENKDLPKQNFLANFSEDLQQKINQEIYYKLLKSTPLFNCNFKEKFMLELSLLFKEEYFQQGKRIFSDGENPEKMFFVLEGTVLLDVPTSSDAKVKLNSDKRKYSLMRFVEKEQMVGEEEFFNQKQRKYRANAETDCLLGSICLQEFLELLNQFQLEKEMYFMRKDQLNIYQNEKIISQSFESIISTAQVIINRDRLIAIEQLNYFQERDSQISRKKMIKTKSILKNVQQKEGTFKATLDEMQRQSQSSQIPLFCLTEKQQNQQIRSPQVLNDQPENYDQKGKEDYNQYAQRRGISEMEIPPAFILDDYFRFSYQAKQNSFLQNKEVQNYINENEIILKQISKSISCILENYSNSPTQDQFVSDSPTSSLISIASPTFLKKFPNYINQSKCSYNEQILNKPFSSQYLYSPNKAEKIFNGLEPIYETQESLEFNSNYLSEQNQMHDSKDIHSLTGIQSPSSHQLSGSQINQKMSQIYETECHNHFEIPSILKSQYQKPCSKQYSKEEDYSLNNQFLTRSYTSQNLDSQIESKLLKKQSALLKQRSYPPPLLVRNHPYQFTNSLSCQNIFPKIQDELQIKKDLFCKFESIRNYSVYFPQNNLNVVIQGQILKPFTPRIFFFNQNKSFLQMKNLNQKIQFSQQLKIDRYSS